MQESDQESKALEFGQKEFHIKQARLTLYTSSYSTVFLLSLSLLILTKNTPPPTPINKMLLLLLLPPIDNARRACRTRSPS
jgi:hypothetical protein